MRAMGTLLREAPRERERYADHIVKVFKVIGGPGFPGQEERIHGHALAAFDRGTSRAGVARQLHAVTTSGDRTRKLRAVRAPTVVIHGSDDPLVRPAGGRSVARAIPNARLVMVPGMGHDLPPEIWPLVAGELVSNARRSADQPSEDARMLDAVA
jgi:pimeloyl-ACP methyl ester carboxylesterase